MKALALASLTALTFLVAGCDHMNSRNSSANASATGSTMDAPTSATGTSSSSQPPAMRGEPMTDDAMWDHLDANRDGYLSKDELMGSPALAQDFEKIDSNGDGRISHEEWNAWGHH